MDPTSTWNLAASRINPPTKISVRGDGARSRHRTSLQMLTLAKALLNFTPFSNSTIGGERTIVSAGVDVRLLTIYPSSRLTAPAFYHNSG